MYSPEKLIIVMIFSALILSLQVSCRSYKIPEIEDIVKLVFEEALSAVFSKSLEPLVGLILGVFSDVLFDDATKENELEFNPEKAYERIQKHIEEQFKSMGELVKRETKKVMDTLINYSDEQNILNEGLQRLDKFKIDYENKFVKCIKQRICDEQTRIRYIGDYIADGNGDLSEVLRRYIFRDNTEDFGKRMFDFIVQSYRHTDEHIQDSPCGIEIQPRQKYMYHVYIYIFGIIIHEYEKILYSQAQRYKELKSANSTDAMNILTLMEDTLHSMRTDLISTRNAVRSALEKIPRDFIRLCDPEKHIRGITYDSLTHFIQPYVAPKYYLKSGPDIGDSQTYFDRRCIEPKWDNHFIWKNSRYECQTYRQLVNCQYLAYTVPIIYWEKKGYGLRFFKTEDGSTQKDYGKWYDWLEKDVLEEYVNRWVYHTSRPSIFDLLLKGGSTFRYEKVQPFYICSLDSLNPNYSGLENMYVKVKGPVEKFLSRGSDFEEVYKNTVRMFSELPVQASSGKIVTGVRFRVLNRIIYMQIQQGEYINGSIYPKSLEWKKLIENQEKVQKLNIHRRSFNLDDVEVPSGSFLTGVQFIFNQDAISLGVYGTKVDKNGNIFHNNNKSGNFSESELYIPPFNIGKRREIVLDKPGPSENAPTDSRHKIMSKPGYHFVKFQPTDFGKNLHSTVPYLDIRDVVDDKLKPLGGVGIEYRGKEGFGGFIGLKLISTDIINKLNYGQLTSSSASPVKKIFDKLKTEV